MEWHSERNERCDVEHISIIFKQKSLLTQFYLNMHKTQNKIFLLFQFFLKLFYIHCYSFKVVAKNWDWFVFVSSVSSYSALIYSLISWYNHLIKYISRAVPLVLALLYRHFPPINIKFYIPWLFPFFFFLSLFLF